MKLVEFDSASSYASFKHNTTSTSALTFSLIPRSAVEGLIAAIVGLSREEYPGELKNSKIAVELRSPVRKINIRYMHINTKWSWSVLKRYITNNYQQVLLEEKRPLLSIPMSNEILVKPSYRFYVDTNNVKVQKQLVDNLIRKQSYYTPCLGVSSCICTARYVGEFDYEPVPNGRDFLPVSSIISFVNGMPKMHLEQGVHFASEEDLPIHLTKERISLGTYQVIYPIKPAKLKVQDRNITKVSDGNYIKFLPTHV